MERYNDDILATMLAFFMLDNDLYAALAAGGADTDLVLEELEGRARELFAALSPTAKDEIYKATLFYRRFALKAIAD